MTSLTAGIFASRFIDQNLLVLWKGEPGNTILPPYRDQLYPAYLITDSKEALTAVRPVSFPAPAAVRPVSFPALAAVRPVSSPALAAVRFVSFPALTAVRLVSSPALSAMRLVSFPALTAVGPASFLVSER